MKLECKNLSLTELTFSEMSQINGGESGWYYLGRAAGAVRDWWNGLEWGYTPGEGAGYDGNAMGLPG